jgi:repressor LexA
MANPTSEAVYQFIRTYIEQHGYNPSQREIADGCYLNQSTVYNQLIRLEAAGLIDREPGRARSICLRKRAEKS